MIPHVMNFIPPREHVILLVNEVSIAQTGKSEEELYQLSAEVNNIYKNIFHRNHDPLTLISSSKELIGVLDKVVDFHKNESFSVSIIMDSSVQDLNSIAEWFNRCITVEPSLLGRLDLKASLIHQNHTIEVVFSSK